MAHGGVSWRSAAVIVTSDTCFNDPTQDVSGKYVTDQLENLDIFQKITKHIVDDDCLRIRDCLIRTMAETDPVLIITVGGTGLCPRDVTPEATSALYERNCNGIATALHFTSLRYSPRAALSRLTSGIVGRCLIINFPGSLKACGECFSCIQGFLEHALDQVRFNPEAIKETHRQIMGQESIELAINKNDNISSTKNIYDTSIIDQLSNIAIANHENISSPNATAQSSEPTPVTCLIESTPKLLIIGDEPLNASSDHVNYQSDCPASQANSNEDEEVCDDFISENENALLTLPSTKILATQSSYPLIDYNHALVTIGTLSYDLLQISEEVHLNSLEEAEKILGDVLAIELTSRRSVPNHPVSTMDGYVLNVPKLLRNIISTIKTIQADLVKDLNQFQLYQEDKCRASTFFCYQVNTGGRLPSSNFAIVPAEKAGLVSSNRVIIREVKSGMYVRQAGSDLNLDDVLEAGTVIRPVELSLIMSMGHKSFHVFRKPTIGILSNGDELIDLFSDDASSQDSVIDTNGPLLTTFYRSRGYQVQNFGITKDEPEQILLKITDCLEKCDILVITGGASMGSRDHVKDVIEHIGGTIHFGRVNIKPGKPASFSSLIMADKRKFIFSLPGNPVSAYITSLVLVLPFIEHGIKNHFKLDLQPTLDSIGHFITVEIDQLVDGDQSYEFDGRLEFVRAKFSSASRGNRTLDLPYRVTVSIKQQSSRMLNLKDCDCLIIIDPSMKGSRFIVGQTYRALNLNLN